MPFTENERVKTMKTLHSLQNLKNPKKDTFLAKKRNIICSFIEKYLIWGHVYQYGHIQNRN